MAIRSARADRPEGPTGPRSVPGAGTATGGSDRQQGGSSRQRVGRQWGGRVAGALVGAVTLVASAGCGVFTTSSNTERPQLEHPALRVGYMQVVDVAPIRLALNEKLFDKAGLQVEWVQESSEADALKQLDTGGLDIVWASDVNLFRAAAGGQQLQLQGEAYQAGNNTMALVAMPNSSYKDASSKPSPTIAVNALDDVGVLTTKSALGTADVEQNKIKFKQVAFQDMQAQLQSGAVDAAWMVEPFITKAQKSIGATIVTDTARGATLNFPMSAYAASKKFADQNPKTLAAFRTALQQAQQQASGNVLSVQDVLPSYADVDSSTAALVSVGTFPASLNPVRLQRVSDMMDTSGLLSSRLDVQPLLPPGVSS